MRIDWSNRNEMTNLNLHDCSFTGYSYDYDKRQISFHCGVGYIGMEFNVVFHNVIFSKMQSCTFWHGGDSIMYIALEEEETELKTLKKIHDEKEYDFTKLDEGISYLSVEMSINSGDMLTIICESIDYEESKG